jgi:hypothetical protein
MAVVGGHVEAADVALDAAQRASAQAAEEPFEPSAGRAASLLANTRAAITIARAGSRGCTATPMARPPSHPRHSVS